MMKGLSTQAKNAALDALADAPVGSGVVLSSYGLASLAAKRQNSNKAAAVAKPRLARPQPPLPQPPLKSRRERLLAPAAAAAAAASEDHQSPPKERFDEEHDYADTFEAAGEGDEAMEEDGEFPNRRRRNGDEDDDDEKDAEKENDDATTNAAAVNTNWSGMLASAANKFRVAGISRRIKRRLE